jgi:hypothetical protein
VVGARGGELQQLGQHSRSGVVHGRAYDHLHGLHLATPSLAKATTENAQQLVYFARDFLLDCFIRFFSSGESTSGSDGRIWQICALISISSL